MLHLHASYSSSLARELRSTSRSQHQLHRYGHENLANNTGDRAVPPIIFLLILLFLIFIVGSQILIVHYARSGTSHSSAHRIKNDLRQMDETMEAIVQKNTLTGEKWQLVFHIQTYVQHFQYLIDLFNQSNETTTHSSDDQQTKRHYCDEEPSQLIGRILEDNFTFPNISLSETEANYSHVRAGGHWSPSDCIARHKVAIIIPYRDRFEHLVTLLYYLHPILQRQELDYRIYVSEQIGNGTYNKGVLMNAAFLYASNQSDFQCFVFHDVDLIPEDDRNMYSCPIFPRHMSVAVNEMNYQLRYEELIGGVLNMRKEHFLTANGYSDLYWGWGAEDDDLYYRLKKVSLKVIRPPVSIGRYRMILHTKRTPSVWRKRAKLLKSAAKRYTWDGVSSVQYNLTSVTLHPLFTHLLIDVGSPPPGFN